MAQCGRCRSISGYFAGTKIFSRASRGREKKHKLLWEDHEHHKLLHCSDVWSMAVVGVDQTTKQATEKEFWSE